MSENGVEEKFCENACFFRKCTNCVCTGKSLSEALLFAEDGENMLGTKIVLNVKTKNNLCTQHVLSLEFSCAWLVIQWTIFCHNVG